MSDNKITSAKEKIAYHRLLLYFIKEYGSLEALAKSLNQFATGESFSVVDIDNGQYAAYLALRILDT